MAFFFSGRFELHGHDPALVALHDQRLHGSPVRGPHSRRMRARESRWRAVDCRAPLGAGQTFGALAIAPFRMLWLGTLTSFLAFFMSTVVNSVVAFELTGANRAVGTVIFAQGIAMFVFGPFGGALADRWPKRRVIAIGQSVAGASFAALALLVRRRTRSRSRISRSARSCSASASRSSVRRARRSSASSSRRSGAATRRRWR